jgi:exopolysaccharide biosynthesis polyprenyl glycosylphosphotransferase
MNFLPLQLTQRRRRLGTRTAARATRRPARKLLALDIAIALASPFVARATFSLDSSHAPKLDAIVLAFITLLTLGALGEYARRPRPRDGFLRTAGRLVLFSGLAVWSATFVVFAAGPDLAFAPMYATWLLLAVGCIWARMLLGYFDHPGVERAVIVGSGRVAGRIAAIVARDPGRKIDVAGYLDDDPAPTEQAPGRFLGGIDSLSRVVDAHKLDLVVVAFSNRSDQSLVSALRSCDRSGVEVVVVPRLYDVLPPHARTYDLGGLALLDASARAAGSAQTVTKRAVDIIGAALALALLSPVFAVVALAIRLDDGGPVIFRQRRVGRDGLSFTICKFRTLTMTSDEVDPATVAALEMDETIELVKRTGATRPTRVGKLLRRTSVDELPQLWNVLRGDMSLVGPRPLRSFEVDALDEWQHARHDMRPGMTGLWQVMGRSDVRWDERLQLDCAYVRNWSLVADVGIIFRTFPAVFRGRGAL